MTSLMPALIPGRPLLPLREIRHLLRLQLRTSNPNRRFISSSPRLHVAIPPITPSSPPSTAPPPEIYISHSTSPTFNLAFERTLLAQSSPTSTILFLYTNAPSVIIGRNQNPWLEANLLALKRAKIALVRRHSGGGTVFHDTGNANWSVICPPDTFTRDKHAEMVVRALNGMGVEGVRVNCRHDIVMDVPVEDGAVNTKNFHVAEGEGEGQACEKQVNDAREGFNTFKISGSAYKLTRTRALHHGTCLMQSPNLSKIGAYLASPLRPYIAGRGVESVRSPVANTSRSVEGFNRAVQREFQEMYGRPSVVRHLRFSSHEGGPILESEREEMQKWQAELESDDWTYNQTPQFTFSTHSTSADPRERPAPPEGLENFRCRFTVRHGKLTAPISVQGLHPTATEKASAELLQWQSAGKMEGMELHKMGGWVRPFLPNYAKTSFRPENFRRVSKWMSGLFGHELKSRDLFPHSQPSQLRDPSPRSKGVWVDREG